MMDLVELVGGPCDGETFEVGYGINTLLIPYPPPTSEMLAWVFGEKPAPAVAAYAYVRTVDQTFTYAPDESG